MRVLVLGAAVSGRGAAALLRRDGTEHLVYDRRPEALASLAAQGSETAAGEWRDELLRDADLVVASPGFAPHSAPLRAAARAGVETVSEMELALRSLTCPLAAVTGTNGKTTVVEQTAAMLREAGRRAAAAGNSGRAASDAALSEWDALVLEASSFQLEYTSSLRPRAAALLNVAPDHLDWHGSMDRYRAAKAKIFHRVSDTELMIYDYDDPGARSLALSRPGGAHVPITGAGREGLPLWGRAGDRLLLPCGEMPLDDVPVRDPAFLTNLTAAAAAAERLGADNRSIMNVISRFRPGAHRRQPAGEGGGVRWVNDSKATNPHAAAAAAAAYRSVVLIAGGRNKGLDLTPLTALPTVRFLIAIGESAEFLLSRRRPGEGEGAGSLEEAVETAARKASPGDTVLFSPGCASFDMFSSYQERGEAFMRLAAEAAAGAAVAAGSGT